MGERLGVVSRFAKFAELYSRYANATRAAAEAGYSKRAAGSTGSRLLRRADVQKLIEGHRVNRNVHAEETYRNLISLAQVALKNVADAMGDALLDARGRSVAIETAGRAWERLAKCEGLMIDRSLIEVDHKVTLAALAERAREWALQMPDLQKLKIIEAPKTVNDTNGNGHNGNGHDGAPPVEPAP